MKGTAATRAGKGHRKVGLPCQDAVATQFIPSAGAMILAVADGLGSKSHSETGANVAVAAAIESLAAHEQWDVRCMLQAYRAARRAIRIAAKEAGVSPSDMATTLQLGVLTKEKAIAAMIGDGGWIAGVDGAPTVLHAPAAGGYANEVTPITSAFWRLGFNCTSRRGATWLAGFTDGLTRLLMTRDGEAWVPHEPFFASFVPRLMASGDETLAQKFLAASHVDAAWDDDKGLVLAVSDAAV